MAVQERHVSASVQPSETPCPAPRRSAQLILQLLGCTQDNSAQTQEQLEVCGGRNIPETQSRAKGSANKGQITMKIIFSYVWNNSI